MYVIGLHCELSISGGTNTTKFGPGTGLSLHLSSHHCTGLETSFFDCMSGSSSGQFSIIDNHVRDIGVICDQSSGIILWPKTTRLGTFLKIVT